MEKRKSKTKSRKNLKVSKDIIFRQLDRDDAILLNMETKNYYSLNETACEIFKGIQKGADREKIIKDLAKKFVAKETTLRKDLDKTLDFLIKEKLVF